MFFAHIPAAYLLNEGIEKWSGRTIPRAARWAAYLGAVAPDVDLLYFYTAGHRRYLHHAYFTHWPSFWLIAAAVLLPWMWFRPDPRRRWVGGLFFLNGFVHLLLDTVVGEIYWGAPWSPARWAIFNVPATHGFWLINFFAHWSIGLEVVITLAALYVYNRDARTCTVVSTERNA